MSAGPRRGRREQEGEELEQPERLGIDPAFTRNLEQKPFGEDLEHRRFVDQSRIEHHIGLFLEGENPATLTSADPIPEIQGPFGGETAEKTVTDQPSHESGVGGEDPVVIIDGQLGQGRNIDSVFPLARDRRGQAIVEPVDAFDDQNLFRPELHGRPPVGRRPTTEDKIEPRCGHRSAVHELRQMIVEELEIDGLQSLEIRLPILVEWRVLTVDVIVVQRQRDRLQTVDPELDSQPLGKGRFPR